MYIEAVNAERFSVAVDLRKNFDMKDGTDLRIKCSIEQSRDENQRVPVRQVCNRAKPRRFRTGKASRRNNGIVRAIVNVVRLSGHARPGDLGLQDSGEV